MQTWYLSYVKFEIIVKILFVSQIYQMLSVLFTY